MKTETKGGRRGWQGGAPGPAYHGGSTYRMMHLADGDHTYEGVGTVLMPDLGAGEALGLGRGDGLPLTTGSEDGLEELGHRRKGDTPSRTLMSTEAVNTEIVVVNAHPAGGVAGLRQDLSTRTGGAVGAVALPGVGAGSLAEIEDTDATRRNRRSGGRGRGV